MHLLCQGNALRLPLADQSVHMCVTSPPYWGLRDYGTATWEGGDSECDHVAGIGGHLAQSSASTRGGANKVSESQTILFKGTCGKCGARRIDSQLGLEPTPDEYIAKMVAVFREVWRVLRDDGTCFLNIADSYATEAYSPWGIKPKDEVPISDRLVGALQMDGWYRRCRIIWFKPNPMPESVTDRPTKSHEYLFLLSKSERYYWDAEAVRMPANNAGKIVTIGTHTLGRRQLAGSGIEPWGTAAKDSMTVASSRNIRSVWNIPTESYAGAHFATFPRKLVEPCIKAGTSEKGCCPECGKPWERVVESERVATRPGRQSKINGRSSDEIGNRDPGRHVAVKTDRGWNPGCHCRDPIDDCLLPPVSCVVFDPFIGSGTTIVVANALGRHGIGLDLSADYLKLASQRITRPHAAIQRPHREESHPLFDRED